MGPKARAPKGKKTRSRSKSAIEYPSPIELERTSGDLTWGFIPSFDRSTVQARKPVLSAHFSATQLEEPEVTIEAPAQLVETTNDFLVVVDEEDAALVTQGTETQLSKPQEEVQLVDTSSSWQFAAAAPALQIQSDDARLEEVTREQDPIVLEEETSGVDVEEEYDWSYLKWFAGGVATYWLLRGKSHTERHHYH